MCGLSSASVLTLKSFWGFHPHSCSTLHALAKKNRPFQWDPACLDVFDTLKDGLTEAPVLALPRDEGLFVLDTDASIVAVGVVLFQV